MVAIVDREWIEAYWTKVQLLRPSAMLHCADLRRTRSTASLPTARGGGRALRVGKCDKALDEATRHGWTVAHERTTGRRSLSLAMLDLCFGEQVRESHPRDEDQRTGHRCL